MAESNHDVDDALTVEISRDRLQAWIRIKNPEQARNLTREELLSVLQKARLELKEPVLARIAEWFDRIARRQDMPPRFLVAEGRPPTQGRDGDFVWLDKPAVQDPDTDDREDRVDFYTQNKIHTVEAGQEIGRIIKAIPAEAGVDVLGERIKPLKQPVEVKMDPPLTLAAHDPTLVVSQVAGCVQYKNHTLSIIEVLDIKGDVDFSTGSIESSVDVMVKGTVRDNFTVKTSRSVHVQGAIEAALVSAGQHVFVQGGILGGNQGCIRAKGDIVAKFCEAGRLDAGGDIRIGKSLLHSYARAKGQFVSERGTVIGGHLYARSGACIGVLGCTAGVPTTVSVGPDPLMLAWLRRQKLQRNLQQSTLLRITEALRPVLLKAHILNDAQRRRVGEMLRRTRKLRNQVVALEEKTQNLMRECQPHNNVPIKITKIVHEGVTIKYGFRQTTFRDGIKGPLRIERRRIDGILEIVAINESTGSITVLPSQQLDDGPLDVPESVVLAGTDPHGRSC